jgi:hypothetical protein
MITAFRGGKEDIVINRKRNIQLENDIRQSGFGFIKVKGYSIENIGTSDAIKVEEESFLVISSPDDDGKLKGFLRKAGQKYNQDSVLYKEPGKLAILIGTNTNPKADPGLNKEIIAGKWKPNTIGQFYTRMKGHRTFTFESVVEPDGVFALWYKNVLSKRK